MQCSSRYPEAACVTHERHERAGWDVLITKWLPRLDENARRRGKHNHNEKKKPPALVAWSCGALPPTNGSRRGG